MVTTINNAPVSEEELAVILLIRAFSGTKGRSVTKFFQTVLNKLIANGTVSNATGRMTLTEEARPVLECITGTPRVSEDDLETLAAQMRELFPAGDQPGTGYPWRCSTSTVVTRLKSLLETRKKSFTNEEALAATRLYVSKMNNGRQIRTLRYFIYKNVNDGGKIEMQSDLLDAIDDIRDGVTVQEAPKTEITNFL
jgi:hypothetical protein